MPRKSHSAAPANIRKPLIDPSGLAAVRIEDVDAIERIKADLIADYHPFNSEELFAIERIAIARHSLLHSYRIESGLFTLGLERAMEMSGAPQILNPEITNGSQVTAGQNPNFWMAVGFQQLNRTSDWQIFLHYQAQAERLYRRAIEEFERIRALATSFPNKPSSNPIPNPKPFPPISPTFPALPDLPPSSD
jgi:hypothetical protein